MSPLVRNIIAIIVGIVIGSIVNMGLIMIGHNVIPPPEGVNPLDMESIKAGMHLYTPKHFVFPFLAHALGTFAGAFLAVKLAANNYMTVAIVIGAFYLAGGVYSSVNLPAPTWFMVTDILLAYIPMAWIAAKIINKN